MSEHIENCTWKIAFQCPLQWAALDMTVDPNVRGCPVCLRMVHQCHSEDEVRQRIAAGDCVSITRIDDYISGEVGEFLGDLDCDLA
jgi:hypothetical protein